jgi:hypothetical protein
MRRDQIPLSRRTPSGGKPKGGAGAVLAGGFAVRSRAVWVSVPRHDDRGGRCSLDWDKRRRVTPVQTTSQEAWPEPSLWDGIIPLGESRGGTPSGVRAPKGRAPHRKMRRWLPCVCRRSASPFYSREDKSKWRVVDREERFSQFSQFAPRPTRNSDADRVARTGSLAPSAPATAGEGDHWSSRSERTVVEGAHDSKLRYRCSTIPPNKFE